MRRKSWLVWIWFASTIKRVQIKIRRERNLTVDHGTTVVVGNTQIGLQEEILKVAISFHYFSLYLFLQNLTHCFTLKTSRIEGSVS